MTTMAPKCAHCADTGNLQQDPHGQLDCAHCTVATERTMLNAWAKQQGILRWSDGVSSWHLWLIYQHGYAAGFTQSQLFG